YCTLSYGINISETAKKIQQAIYNSLTTMTTIEPSQINVHITHIEPIN
ncbi:Asp23/Gls24 family envelope stress response protein, partial [Staphylococcus xylosus]